MTSHQRIEHEMAIHDALPPEWRRVSMEYGLRPAVIARESGFTPQQAIKQIQREYARNQFQRCESVEGAADLRAF